MLTALFCSPICLSLKLDQGQIALSFSAVGLNALALVFMPLLPMNWNMLKSQCCPTALSGQLMLRGPNLSVTGQSVQPLNVQHTSLITHPCLSSSFLISTGKCCHNSSLSLLPPLTLSFSSLSLFFPPHPVLHFLYPSTFPPRPPWLHPPPLSLPAAISPLTPLTPHSDRTCCIADMRWHITPMCVCIWVCVRMCAWLARGW